MDDKYSKWVVGGLIVGFFSSPFASCKEIEPARPLRLGYSLQMPKEVCNMPKEQPHIHQDIYVSDSTGSTASYLSASATGPTSIAGSLTSYANNFRS